MPTPDKPKLLLVEDNSALREQMRWALTDAYQILEAGSMESCLEVFSRERPSILCLDMGLDNIPDKGLEIIDRILTIDRQAKIVVITANTTESLGRDAVRKGAFDFLHKPVDIDKLRVILERAARIVGLEDPQIPSEAVTGLPSQAEFLMVGASKPMLRIFDHIRKLAPTDVCALITGESGTGKELCARAIHYHSLRRDKPFVPINCGAIPETLIESELFGYVKGSFTGANTDKIGLIESANSGTLFLDEIADMPKILQVKLLRFLEDQQLQRIGETVSRKVDVRILAATNKKDVGSENNPAMRTDLYFRLSEFEIQLPPLRERKEDLPLIAAKIIERNRERFSQPRLSISNRAEQLLLHYAWPGNVRELENKLNRATITCVNQTIEPDDLQLAASSFSNLSLKDARDMFEKEFLVAVLRRTNYNISETAKIAGISRPTLYDMMKKLEIRLTVETRIAE